MLIFFCTKKDKLNDAFLIHSLFQVAKTMHDRIDFMSEKSETERISSIIN